MLHPSSCILHPPCSMLHPPKDSKRVPEESKRIQKDPKGSKGIQMGSKGPKGTKWVLEGSKRVQKDQRDPKGFKRLEKDPKDSKKARINALEIPTNIEIFKKECCNRGTRDFWATIILGIPLGIPRILIFFFITLPRLLSICLCFPPSTSKPIFLRTACQGN